MQPACLDHDRDRFVRRMRDEFHPDHETPCVRWSEKRLPAPILKMWPHISDKLQPDPQDRFGKALTVPRERDVGTPRVPESPVRSTGPAVKCAIPVDPAAITVGRTLPLKGPIVWSQCHVGTPRAYERDVGSEWVGGETRANKRFGSSPSRRRAFRRSRLSGQAGRRGWSGGNDPISGDRRGAGGPAR